VEGSLKRVICYWVIYFAECRCTACTACTELADVSLPAIAKQKFVFGLAGRLADVSVAEGSLVIESLSHFIFDHCSDTLIIILNEVFQ